MALITGSGLFIVSVLTAALSRTVAEEIEAWSPSIIRGLIKLAVGWLPENQRERFEEEWQSHVSEVPGKVGKLLVAAGFLIAAHNMALTGRRNQVVESLSRRLEQFDEAYSRATTAVDRIQDGTQNDETLHLEILLVLANKLSSCQSEIREWRNRLAAHAAAASAAPQTLVANLFYTLRGNAILRRGDQLSQETAPVIEIGAQIAKAIEERKTRLGI